MNAILRYLVYRSCMLVGWLVVIKEGSKKRKKWYSEKLPSRLVGGQRADKA